MEGPVTFRLELLAHMTPDPSVLHLDHQPEPPVSVAADWVFAYGSLIWSPEVPWEERCPALLRGYHRAFCIRSTMYRGTPEAPGLVLGLDYGGSCRGMVYRLTPEHRDQSLAALYAREMSTRAYVPRKILLTLCDGRKIEALAFVANRSGQQYVRLNDAQTVDIIARSCGQKGPNIDYVLNTVEALQGAGIRDQRLEAVARMAQQQIGMPEGRREG